MTGSIGGLVNLNTTLKTLIGCKRWEIRDLGWGPKTRHLVFVLLFLWGGNHAASRKTTATCIYIYRGKDRITTTSQYSFTISKGSMV